jgi:hypothetical protein
MCICDECYYGSRCQLSTIGFALSLDAILGYQILPQISFIHQTLSVKISTTISTSLFVIGFISACLSIVTFRRKESREVGCGFYLYSSSICLIITIIVFIYKFWFLILSQMLIITNDSLLKINCVLIDYLLRSLLSLGDWLNACVAIERAISITKGIKFNKSKSIRIAKMIIVFVILLTFASHLQDPSAMIIIHFFTPFIVNFLSAIFIIIRIVQRRLIVKEKKFIVEEQESKIKRQLSIERKRLYKEIIYQQIRKHNHAVYSYSIGFTSLNHFIFI